MVEKSVIVQRTVQADADALWQTLGDFTGGWHPYLAWVRAEAGNRRRFQAKDEAGEYVERLTYHSDSDRCLSYAHEHGIEGAEWYHAQCRVSPSGDDCSIEWRATFSAPEGRAQGIAKGTTAVFEAGIDEALRRAVLTEVRIGTDPTLAFTQSFEQDGPLCLFLHGIGGRRSNWKSQLHAVAPIMQSAALDLRGYGESTLGSSPSMIDDYCNDILRVMQYFGKQHVVLVGLSYGAWIATSFAMRYPEMLLGLVLSGGCTGLSEATDAERKGFLQARQKPLDAGKTPADFAADVVALIAGPTSSESSRKELYESMAAIPAATYRDAVTCFSFPTERFDFSRITSPVLLMTGEYDRLASPAEIRGVAERIHQAGGAPLVRFEVIGGVGHVCNIEAPKIYNAQLTDFLRNISK
jgi:pimeloyl-ACP methyl ester carboxylesterase